MSMIPVSMVRTLVTGSVVSFSIVLYAFLFADVQPCGPGGKPLDGAGACFNGTNTHFKTLLYLALAVWVTTVTVSFVLYMHRIRSLPRGRHTVFQTVMAVLLAVAMIAFGYIALTFAYVGSTLT